MLKTRQELDTLRQAYACSFESEKNKILVCGGTGCVAGGSLVIYDNFIKIMQDKGINCTVELTEDKHEDSVGVKRSGCHGFCEMGPLVRIEPDGILYTKVKPEDCEEIIEKTILNNGVVDRLSYNKNGIKFKTQEEIPFYKKQTRVVLEHCGHIDATSIKEYLAIGGYMALERALFDMTKEDILDEIEKSTLRGRGGGGFPTGRKWRQVARQKEPVHYVVCNGDEGDPGAFMDRSIMEGDPHRMLEGMMIAAYAVGAQEAYIYVRA